VAFTTGFGVTGPFEAIFDVIPVPRVRIGHQTASGAVTLQANVAIGMAGLTGGQVFPRFTGMAISPHMTRQHRIGMTALALFIGEEGMTTAEGAVGEPFTMGLKRQIVVVEIIVAFDAELVLMTFVAELRVGARRDRVGDSELGAVNIGHGIAEVPHLVGTAGLVTIEAEILFMTGSAINGLGDRGATMRQRPGDVMRDQAWQFDTIDKSLIVAVKTDFAFGNNLLRVRHMAGDAAGIVSQDLMFGVIKVGGPECRCPEEQTDVEQ
jgi:hypothetical protein